MKLIKTTNSVAYVPVSIELNSAADLVLIYKIVAALSNHVCKALTGATPLPDANSQSIYALYESLGTEIEHQHIEMNNTQIKKIKIWD